jgi:alpha-ketoglutarate-dependent taurine dioxygenase
MQGAVTIEVDSVLCAQQSIPLVCSLAGASLPTSAEQRSQLEAYLLRAGAVLLRGGDVQGVEGFRAFARGFGTLLSYEFGSTPRTDLGAGVFTSTEYPAHRGIPLHNEQAYTSCWPMKLWFYCEVAAPSGGATPIADSRRIYARIPAAIRQRFERNGLLYVRNYGGGLDVDWPQVFGTHDPSEVARMCEGRGIRYEWWGDRQLRTWERVQAVARHPRTRELVWFNQAHLFHVSALLEEEREALLDICGLEAMPRNVYYGDGTSIEDGVLDEIRAVLAAEQVVFPWHAGDILMLDNMLVAHAREPFRGPRKVLVAMAEPYPA